tara:strand:+ start:141 stop:587 length:447 start_codon:yes stop_codon:yes gene_type:complete
MKAIKRSEIAAKYGPCVSCGNGTRSHVLEAAEWEEYEEEVVVARSDDLASKQWEEVDTVTKYALVKENTVMCHKCWLEKAESYATVIDSNFDKWVSGGVTSIRPVMKVLQGVRYLDIESELSNDTNTKLNTLRSMTKGLLSGKSGEEE